MISPGYSGRLHFKEIIIMVDHSGEVGMWFSSIIFIVIAAMIVTVFILIVKLLVEKEKHYKIKNQAHIEENHDDKETEMQNK